VNIRGLVTKSGYVSGSFTDQHERNVSILDIAFKAAQKLLGETTAAVEAKRQELTEQAVQDSVRRTRERQLSHPGLVSTPYPKAIAQQAQEIHRLRNAAEKAALDALAASMALEAAQKTLESLEEADRRHDFLHKQRGEHPSSFVEWQELVDALFARGVTKHTLKQISKLETSLIADLLRWKKEDPRHVDPASPWQDLLRSYSSRTLQILEGKDSIALSRPGAPPRSQTWGAKYWHRDEALRWHNGLKDRERTKDEMVYDDSFMAVDESEADSRATLIDDRQDTVIPIQPISVDTEVDMPALRIEPIVVPPRADDTATPPADNLSAGAESDEKRALPEVGILDIRRSTSIAESYFDHECGPGTAFWAGTGLPVGTFDTDRLIPALEHLIAHGKHSYLQKEFLFAAQEGAAEDFYNDVRFHRATQLSNQLRAGDRQLFDEVAKLGLLE
jgi:hypothetical protein